MLTSLNGTATHLHRRRVAGEHHAAQRHHDDLHATGPTAAGAAPRPPAPDGRDVDRDAATTAPTAPWSTTRTSRRQHQRRHRAADRVAPTRSTHRRPRGPHPAAPAPQRPARWTARPDSADRPPAPAPATTCATGTARSPALVDSTGTVTATYAYDRLRRPGPRRRPAGRPGARPTSGRANPYTYLARRPGARSTYAGDRAAGLPRPHLRSRSRPVHQPRSGRRPQPLPGFNTNPIVYADLAGSISIPTSSSTASSRSRSRRALSFTAGAAVGRGRGAVAAVEVGEMTAGAVINAAGERRRRRRQRHRRGHQDTAGRRRHGPGRQRRQARNCSAPTDRSNLEFANQVATLVGGVTGVAAGLTDFTVGAAEEATEAAAQQTGRRMGPVQQPTRASRTVEADDSFRRRRSSGAVPPLEGYTVDAVDGARLPSNAGGTSDQPEASARGAR